MNKHLVKGRKKKPISVERLTKRSGWLFCLPWLIGLIFFFFIPFIQSVAYSFSQVTLSDMLELKFLGLENYRYILFEDANFVRDVTEQAAGLAVNIPIIMFFSVFVALLLNGKFRGRLLARSLFFLPVIIAAGVVTAIIQNDVFTKNVMRADTAIFQSTAMLEILYRLNLSPKIINTYITVTSQVFDLSWKTGVPILLFLSALQGIPQTYYEVASIEGANRWDSFWKVIFPSLTPAFMLATIYTIVESFTDMSNNVMKSIVTRFSDMKYGYASASAILYFLVVIVILLLVIALFFRKSLRNN